MSNPDGLLPLERLARRLGLHPASSGIHGPLSARESARLARRQPPPPTAPTLPPVNLTETLRAQIDRHGPDGFAVFCDVVHADPPGNPRAWLLDPPRPWRKHLRVLYAVDPNPRAHQPRVALIVPATVPTCTAAAAATFGVDAAHYAPAREV